jgi:hypothetical protein
MNIMLGNLSVEQIEERLGIVFPEYTKTFMLSTWQQTASNIAKGKWHRFDMPFMLLCGDMDTATKIFKALEPQHHLCKDALQISIAN